MEWDSESVRLDMAGAHLDDAFHGRNIPFVPRAKELQLYKLYKHPVFSVMLFIVYFVYLGLAFFEKPAHERLAVPFWMTVIVEFVCLAFFICRFLHEMFFTSSKTFWQDTKHVTVCVILGLILVDIVVYTIVTEIRQSDDILRWSRPLRPLVIVNFPECRQVGLIERDHCPDTKLLKPGLWGCCR